MNPIPANGRNGGFVGSLIKAILSLVDALSSGKRILVFLLLVIVGAFGYVLYQVRDQLRPAMLVLLAPRWSLVSEKELHESAGIIRQQLGAVVVTIWSVDLARNQRVVEAIEGPPDLTEAIQKLWPPHKVLPFFIKTPIPNANKKLIAALSGDVECGPIIPAIWNSIPGNEMLAQHVKVTCMSGMPSTSDAFIGLMSVGFDHELTDIEADFIATQLTAWADRLAVRSR